MGHVPPFVVSEGYFVLVEFEDPPSSSAILREVLGEDGSERFMIGNKRHWGFGVEVVAVFVNGPYYCGTFQVGHRVVIF